MRIILLFLLTFLPSILKAECNFVTAKHIDGLSNPKSIKNIEIEVPKSSNYIKNFFKLQQLIVKRVGAKCNGLDTNWMG